MQVKIGAEKPNLSHPLEPVYLGFKAIQESGLIDLPQSTKDWIAAMEDHIRIRSKG